MEWASLKPCPSFFCCGGKTHRQCRCNRHHRRGPTSPTPCTSFEVPLHRSIIGPFQWIIPCMNISLAAVLVVWTHAKFPQFCVAAVTLLVFDYGMSRANVLFAHDHTWVGTSLASFCGFIALFLLPIVTIHYLLLTQNAKMNAFWFQTTRTWQILGSQILRLAGASFFMLQSANLVPKIFGIHTGVLDVAMGITAPMVAYRVYKSGVRANKTLLYLWNAVGLYDFVWALGYIFLNYFGLIGKDEPPLAVMGFHPMTLLATYQVAWAFTLHVVILVYMNKFKETELVASNKRM